MELSSPGLQDRNWKGHGASCLLVAEPQSSTSFQHFFYPESQRNDSRVSPAPQQPPDIRPSDRL